MFQKKYHKINVGKHYYCEKKRKAPRKGGARDGDKTLAGLIAKLGDTARIGGHQGFSGAHRTLLLYFLIPQEGYGPIPVITHETSSGTLQKKKKKKKSRNFYYCLYIQRQMFAFLYGL